SRSSSARSAPVAPSGATAIAVASAVIVSRARYTRWCCPREPPGMYDARDGRSPVFARVPATASGTDADLDDAAGRALFPRLSRGTRARVVSRALPDPRARLRGHAAADR